MDNDVVIDKKFFDPTFSLLDKFREVAPGSYKHCQNVANICESIAIELDLNVDLLKCAALYHDVGKMNNPSYFSENQTDGINVHDNLDPYISYQIITRHVGDSVLYLIQLSDLPSEVIEIVSQHHGDTVLQSIFNKCKNEPEERFRYKCARPVSTEALILMIVDSVEATAKSLYASQANNSSEFVTKSINGTIMRLTDDRQLDNMRIGTLNTTKRILTKEIESIYHKRVTYDEEEKTIGEIKEETNNTE